MLFYWGLNQEDKVVIPVGLKLCPNTYAGKQTSPIREENGLKRCWDLVPFLLHLFLVTGWEEN